MIHGNHIINKIAEDIQNNHIEKLSLYDLRFQDYIQSLKIQEKVHAFVQKENISGVVLTMNYPNLYTIGKSGNKSDILVPQEDLDKKGIQIYESNRGGEITYHGPGQLIYYPIINLKKLALTLKSYLNT